VFPIVEFHADAPGAGKDRRDEMAGPIGGLPRQGILSLAIKDKGALYNAYMPFVKGGGLFVPTAKRYGLGDEVFILLTLMEDKDRLPIAGKVIWVTPPGAQGNRTAGIGVQFNESADGETARTKIESLLAGIMNADRPTHTM
jgi:type IV pilus assembly protein PilZ